MPSPPTQETFQTSRNKVYEIRGLIRCPPSVRQRLKRPQHSRNPCPLPQLCQHSAGSILISFPRVGRIGPHSVINNLRRFLQVHVHRRLTNIEPLLHPLITSAASVGLPLLSGMV